MARRLALAALVVSLLFLAFGGLYGGVEMLRDPSGGSLGMDVVLPQLPVPDFFLPGLFLLTVMGVVPLALVVGLLARPSWGWAAAVTRWGGHHWAWTGTLALGIVLGVWLAVQGWMIGFAWPIQYVTAGNGVAILALTLLPVVRRSYASPA